MNENQITKNIQAFLNANYNAGLVEDGIYGPKTRAAVKKMQQSLGITADGWWGTQTQAAVAKANNNIVPTVSNIRYKKPSENVWKQRTTKNDLAFMYKNPGESNSNAQTIASTPNNADSMPQTNEESNVEGIPYRQRLSSRIFEVPARAFLNLLTTKSSEFNPGYGIRQSSSSSVSFKRYGGKILMNFITK